MTVTLTLIAVTSFISLAALYVDQRILETGMLRPYRTVRKGTWYEVISSGFLHGSVGHLLVNMFVLFFFGIVIEQTLGLYHYLALYFTGLVFSALPSLIRHRENPNYATLGASGAVESVLFGYIFLYPTEKIIIILLPIPIPAWIFGLMFLLYSVFESKRGGGNVNHEAHIAGALWGVLYLLFFVPNSVDHFLTVLGLI
ncbi:rhomboid family intramembrane serine protease [Rhodohalobacter halophilus]|uniref:rhomboid family intramembrane serine protease n=1 Tax=Rhodohalobacter halophilus TaxID=1812810 RepID=UPI00083FCF5B|nr:rhomboid family intramembrane serine protease [Rhodohalobacter halophilus]